MAGDADVLPLERDRLPGPTTSDHRAPLLEPSGTNLDSSLHRLELFLSFLGFHSRYSLLNLILCASAFLLLGVVVPVATMLLTRCPAGGCEGYRIERFEVTVLVFQILLAAVSLACVSRNLFKYGIRKFLFVDEHHGQVDRFQKEYVRKIQVASILQVVGIVLCLHSAAKMSHRAQGVASVVCKWHALIACSSTDPSQARTNSHGNMDGIQTTPLMMNYSESDLESLDNTMHINIHPASYMSSYHKRQALAMYLQTNAGGITIFGWIIDRVLMNTIFFLELTLVLFVLGKTIVFTSK